MKRKEIALVKETRQSKFVERIMNTISPHLQIKSSDKIAIKIILDGSKEIYANTHYETVESLIFFLKDNFGVTDMTVIEGSDGAQSCGKTTWDIFYKFRYKEVELNGAKLVNLDDLPHNNKLQIDTLYGQKEISYTTFDADYTIFVLPPKTHNIFPATLSLSSVLGFVKPKDRNLIFSSYRADHRKLNQLNFHKYQNLLEISSKNIISLYKKVPASLLLLDGLFGMEGKGPVKGSPVFHGFSIASEDPVCVDSLAAYIMGFEKSKIPYIEMAEKEGLGNSDWNNNLGVEPQIVKFPYRPHPIFHKFKGGSQKKSHSKGNNRNNSDQGKFNKESKHNNNNNNNNNNKTKHIENDKRRAKSTDKAT